MKNMYLDQKACFFITCLRSLVFHALEPYSKDPGSCPGEDTCFSHQLNLLPAGGHGCTDTFRTKIDSKSM